MTPVAAPPLADDSVPGPAGLSAVEARALMDVRGPALQEVLARARRTRERFQGPEARLCRGVAATPDAPAGCSHAPAPGASLRTHDEILGEVRAARGGSAGQCGVNVTGMDADLAPLLARWKAEGGVRCVALGSVPRDALEPLRTAGLQSVHCTLGLDRSPFPGTLVDPADDADVRNLLQARYACFHVCGGGVLGCGENRDQRQAWLTTLRDMDVNVVLLVFADPGESQESRQALVAVARLVHPTRDVLVAGLDADAALDAGATGLLACSDAEMAAARDALVRRGRVLVDVLHSAFARDHVRVLAEDNDEKRPARIHLPVLG